MKLEYLTISSDSTALQKVSNYATSDDGGL